MNRRLEILGVVLLLIVALIVGFVLKGAFFTPVAKPAVMAKKTASVPVPAKAATPAPVAPTPAPATTVQVVACNPCCCCPCPPVAKAKPAKQVKPQVKKVVPAPVVKKPAPAVVATVPVPEKKAPAPAPKVVAVVVPTPTPAPVANEECPQGWGLIPNVWSRQALPEDLRKKVDDLIKTAKGRDSHRGDAVSRTVGGELRRRAQRFPLNAEVRVLYRDPLSQVITREVGTFNIVSGVGDVNFSDDPRRQIVEVVWPEKFISPAGQSFWIYPDEWGKMCKPNVHGLVP